MRFGMHLKFSEAPQIAKSLGCKAVQVFCGNPRGWQKSPLDPDFIAKFRAGVKAADLDPVVVHATYLINLAAPNDNIYKLSCEGFIAELRRSVQLGAKFYVIHIGNHVGSGAEAGRKRVAECMKRAVREVENCPEILCENTAGGGSTLGGTFEDVAAVMEVANVDKFGMCLDTCHALAAGYDIRKQAGVEGMLDKIDATVGLKRLRCLHFNDSKGALGSHLDRHEHIGRGEIGIEGFRALLADKRVWHLPAILETPKDEPTSDVENLWRTIELAVTTGAVKAADVGTRPAGVTTPSDKPLPKKAKPAVTKKPPAKAAAVKNKKKSRS